MWQQEFTWFFALFHQESCSAVNTPSPKGDSWRIRMSPSRTYYCWWCGRLPYSRETRVVCLRFRPLCHHTSKRIKFMATAACTCCRCVFANP